MRLVILTALAIVLAPAASLASWASVTLDCKLTPVSILNDVKGQLTAVQPTSRDELLITFTGFDEKSGSATVLANNGSAGIIFCCNRSCAANRNHASQECLDRDHHYQWARRAGGLHPPHGDVRWRRYIRLLRPMQGAMRSFACCIMIVALAITGCSDNTEHELAACKLKAMEKWPEPVST